jgi:hypothetical protein
MGAFSVLTGAVYLLLPPLSHGSTHPETDSVGDVPLLYIIWYNIMLGLGEKPAIGRLEAETTSTKTPVLAFHTQGESASGARPTNLRISAGSSRIKSTK